MAPTPEPLAALKAAKATLAAALRWIENPQRTDARRNIATYDLKAQRATAARMRDTVARTGDAIKALQAGNGGGR